MKHPCKCILLILDCECLWGLLRGWGWGIEGGCPQTLQSWRRIDECASRSFLSPSLSHVILLIFILGGASLLGCAGRGGLQLGLLSRLLHLQPLLLGQFCLLLPCLDTCGQTHTKDKRKQNQTQAYHTGHTDTKPYDEQQSPETEVVDEAL